MTVDIYFNPARKVPGEGAPLANWEAEPAAQALAFHKTFAEYAPTPLHALPHLARDFGLGKIFVKDESWRFGLNAFKVLGCAYAIGKYLANKLEQPLGGLSAKRLCSPQARKKMGKLVFAAATDGNHGCGVAWTARQLDQKAVIYMPKGSAQSRVENVRAFGATCEVTDLNYDDTVRMVWDLAQKNGWIMVQDTQWDGYEQIPAWIMQGYMTLAVEALAQMRAFDAPLPTHVFLQAGVGSFAGAVTGHLAAVLGAAMPTVIIVEAHKANCIYKSAMAGDGRPHSVTGELGTLMAGLACGDPNPVSWPILRDYATAYISCEDFRAANGMRILAAPLPGDPPIVSGESGAVTTGILQWIMQDQAGQDARNKLGLNASSTVLLISTEGDTSPTTYRDVVWFGKYSQWCR